MTPPSDFKPPRWINGLLNQLLEPRLFESSVGDLEEKFQRRIAAGSSPWKASVLYSWEGLGFLRMVKRKKRSNTLIPSLMIQHALLFFSRLVRKDKSYYLVSLLGLTLSLTSFLFIMMFINDELSYDKFHQNHDRIYRIVTHLKLNDVEYDMAASQFPAAAALQAEFPEVEQAARIYPVDLTLESGDKKFLEHIYFADENFFQVFSFSLLQGDMETVMREPASIVLTQTTAKKYFGNENPIGKAIINDNQTLVVSGVIKDVPKQSHLQFDAIIPLALQLGYWKAQTGLDGRENKWFWVGSYTYLLFKNAADASNINLKLPLIIQKYFPDRYKATSRIDIQSLTDIHLKSNLEGELEPGGSILYVRFFSIVALVIMVVSSINLINLSYFKLSGRVREIGVRKFLGQGASTIVSQLSLESTLLGVLAFVIAIALCQIFLSQFNLLVQKDLHLWSPPNLLMVGLSFVVIMIVCLVAVVRPALRYGTKSSSYLLLQSYRNAGAANRLRNMMIGLQVCFSFVLLAFSFIISSQIAFFKNKDLGFDKKNVVVVNLNSEVTKSFEAFKTELKKSKDVVDVAGAETPGNAIAGWRFVPEGGSYEKPVMLPFTSCDYGFLNTMNIKLLEGVNFDPNNRYDSVPPFLINKRAAVELGWQNEALGKRLEIFAPGQSVIMMKGKVIGVFDDYHFESLHRPVKPLVLTVAPYFPSALIKLSVPVNDATIAHIQTTWKTLSDKPFEYEILDKRLEKLYDNETKLSNVILFFTFIALYLTCYGLFAMSSLLFSSKLKEVAIRKVFGADQFTIIKQFYTRYAAFNLAAIVVGLPIAFYLCNLWLQSFQYRIELTSDFFIKAGLWTLVAGLLSVSYYLARVAFSNPIRFLRNE